MLCSVEKGVEETGNCSFGTDILAYGFTQLPAEGRSHFKEFLQNLVSMQNTMTGADNTQSSSNENQEGR